MARIISPDDGGLVSTVRDGPLRARVFGPPMLMLGLVGLAPILSMTAWFSATAIPPDPRTRFDDEQTNTLETQ